MRSLKLMAAAAVLTGLVAGSALAQEAPAVETGVTPPAMESTAAAPEKEMTAPSETMTKKAHRVKKHKTAKKHMKKKKKAMNKDSSDGMAVGQ